ncbi:protein HEG [Mustelus asterias]
MATCALLYPIYSLMLLLLLLSRPLLAGASALPTERSSFTHSTDSPLNPEAESLGWEEASSPESWRTRSAGTDSFSTWDLGSVDRRQSPPEAGGGSGSRNQPNKSITSESWTHDSQSNSTHISSTGEMELYLQVNSTFMEINEVSTSSIPVTNSSQSPLLTLTSTSIKESITTDSESTNHSYPTVPSRDIISTDLFDSGSQPFTSSLDNATSGKNEEFRSWPHHNTSKGTDNLERLFTTSPSPLYTVPNVSKTPLNTLPNVPKRSLSTEDRNSESSSSTSLNDPKVLSNLLNIYERSLNSTQNYMKGSLNTSPNDSERLNTLQNDFKRSLSASLNDSERSNTSTNDVKRSLSTLPNYSKISTISAQNDPEWSSTLINVFENSSDTSPSNSEKSNTSLNDFKRSLSTLPNYLKVSTVGVHNDSETSSTLTNDFENPSNSSQSDTERSASTSPNYSKRSLSTSLNDLERVSTSPNVSESALNSAQNYSENSLSTSLSDSKSSLSYTPNNSENPLSTSSGGSKMLNATTNSSEETIHPHSTSIPMDFNDVINGSDAVKSQGISSTQSVDTQTSGSRSTAHSFFISGAETITAITATSHLLPRITDDFLNTTVLSEIYNIENSIATTLSSMQSDSEVLVNDFTELSSNFTTANSSELDFVESETNSFVTTQVARTATTSTTLRSVLPEGTPGYPRTSKPMTTNAHLSSSTMEPLMGETGGTSSAPIVITSGSHTRKYTTISQVPTVTPKPALISTTGSEFATEWTSPPIFMSTPKGDKTTVSSVPTTAFIKTTELTNTRTSVNVKFLTSVRTSTSTRASTSERASTSTRPSTSTRSPISTMMLTSVQISDSTTEIPTTPTRTLTSTKPPTTKGKLTPEPTTVIHATSTSIPEIPTASTDNLCISNPCLNGGTCVKHCNNSRKCACPPNWQGMNCSKDVDECLSNPCPSRAKCVNSLGSFTCKCYPGYYLEKGTRCTLARTFAGVFYNDNKSRISRMQELEGDILKMLNASLFFLNGYHTSVVADLSEAEGSVSVLNMFILSSNVTTPEVLSSVQNYIKNCGSNTGSCQFVLTDQLSYKAEKLCSLKVPECDNATAECNDYDGIAVCQCKDGYFKYNAMDHSCRACDDGYKLENGTCAPCMFGFGGFNCKNPYKLITVVIAAAGGGLLLILGIALTIMCCRKDKNDIGKLIFKSGDFQRSPYAEFPKNPRISVEWGRETIELQENGSTKNLLQMTDVYYSSGLRVSEVDRNGLHPYSGLPGSRYSCIYTGQYNPSFSSEETRRRDYF